MSVERVFGVVKGHKEHITDHTGRLYSDNEVADILNTVHEENEKLKHRLAISEKANFVTALEKENKRLKEQIEYQEEGIVDAIDSLMELPSATIYLLKQWIDAFEEYDSIEDMKNTFSERIKELEE